MLDTISISQLQKSLSKEIKNSGFKYILCNNQKSGLLIGQKMMQFLEEMGFLEEYEDWILSQDQEAETREKEAEKMFSKNDFTEALSFDDLCQSN